MRTVLASAAALCSVIFLCPAAVASDAPSCLTPSFMFTSPNTLTPRAEALTNGDVAVFSAAADGTTRVTLRRAQDGALRYAFSVPRAFGTLVLDDGPSAPAGSGAVLGVSLTGCPSFGVTTFTDTPRPRRGNQPVMTDRNTEFLGVGVGPFGAARGVAAETRSDNSSNHERTYYNQRYRDTTPTPMRGSVDVLDLSTGDSLLHLDKPLDTGPGPISGFYPTASGGAFAALLDSTDAGAESTVVAYRGRTRLWRSQIATLPQAGIFLPLAHGPAFVTSSSLSVGEFTTTVLNHRVSALDGSTGRERWSQDLPPSPLCWIYAVAGDLLVNDEAVGTVRRYSGATGALLWSASYHPTVRPQAGPGAAVLPLDDALSGFQTLYLQTGAISPTTALAAGNLTESVDLNHDGVGDWIQPVKTGYTGDSASGTFTGVVRALDGKTLQVLWSADVAAGGGQPVISTVTTGRGTRVAVLLPDGSTTLLDGTTGHARWMR